MHQPLSSQELEQLGLASATFGEGESLVFPADPTARGGAAANLALGLSALVASDFAGTRFDPTRLAVLERSGVRLEVLRDDRDIVKIVLPGGAQGAVRGLREDPDARQDDPLDPATRYVDLRRSGPVFAEIEEGNGVLLVPEDDRIVIFPVFHAPPCVEPLAEIGSDLATWCTACDDAWLVDQVRARVLDDPWEHAVAVGLYARSLEPQSGERIRQVVERLSAGEVDEDFARASRWARALGPEQRRSIEDLALAEVDRLHARITDLAETMDLDDPSWREDLAELCRARDDLQGVRLLLIEAGAGRRIGASLPHLDAEGKLLLWSLPRVIAVEDEQLRRAAAAEPAAWWTRLVSAREAS